MKLILSLMCVIVTLVTSDIQSIEYSTRDKKLFNFFSAIQTPAQQCSSLGGSLIDNECYQYFNEQVSFETARMRCQARNGDLWTPNTNDPFLITKIVSSGSDLSAMFGSQSRNVWIGSTNTKGRVNDLNGRDTTADFLVAPDAQNPGLIGVTRMCNGLSFRSGGPAAHVVPAFRCANNQGYVCEYPITATPVKKF